GIDVAVTVAVGVGRDLASTIARRRDGARFIVERDARGDRVSGAVPFDGLSAKSVREPVEPLSAPRERDQRLVGVRGVVGEGGLATELVLLPLDAALGIVVVLDIRARRV